MKVFNFCWSLSWYTSPVIMTLLYRKGFFNIDGMVSIGKVLVSLGLVYSAAFFLRGVGRLTNSDYMVFMDVLMETVDSPNTATLRQMRCYDFEFWAWPVDFAWDEGGSRRRGDGANGSKVQASSPRHSASIPVRILGYLAIHSFGRRMVFPGSTALMNTLVGGMLDQGRANLVEQKNGLRAKILTEDGNEIDTMFMDQRRPGMRKAHILVVCFEGNAGFYEMGCSGTPLDAGYSVLGWNHPGFAGSTGDPYPSTEQNAIDAVMQYAIYRLGFIPSNIALFAWSIGGYGASWAAMNYPDVKFVIMDATFDDLVPLALTQMPHSWSNIVTTALRNHMNLNVADQLAKYPGPVKIIRRVRDEIISTEKRNGVEPVLASNRGNFLLIKILRYRYPKVLTAETLPVLRTFLGMPRRQQETMLQDIGLVPHECENRVHTYLQRGSSDFPCRLGEYLTDTAKDEMTLYLAYMHLDDYDSTHCQPLPSSHFTPAWDINCLNS